MPLNNLAPAAIVYRGCLRQPVLRLISVAAALAGIGFAGDSLIRIVRSSGDAQQSFLTALVCFGMVGVLRWIVGQVRLSLSDAGIELRLGADTVIDWADVADVDVLPWYVPRGGATFLPAVRLRGAGGTRLLDIPDVFAEPRAILAAQIESYRTSHQRRP